MAVAPIDLTMPYALPPNLFTSQIGQPNTSDHKAGNYSGVHGYKIQCVTHHVSPCLGESS